MKAQTTIKISTNNTENQMFETHLLLHLLLLILLMNHSSLCLYQSHACKRKAQRTETKRQREMAGQGVRVTEWKDDSENTRNQSLAWYEWRAVEYRSVFPAGFLLSQFVLLMFLGAVLLIVHFSVPICWRTFQTQAHTAGLDAVYPYFDPSIINM